MKKVFNWMLVLGAGVCAAGLVSCATKSMPAGHITKQPFGTTPEGKPVDLYTLQNSKGAEARIMTYGGIVVSLKMPDKAGALGDVVLGYDSLGGYIKTTPYFGALIGRYGNRIAKGKFTLDGKEYTLAKNNGPKMPDVSAPAPAGPAATAHARRRAAARRRRAARNRR